MSFSGGSRQDDKVDGEGVSPEFAAWAELQNPSSDKKEGSREVATPPSAQVLNRELSPFENAAGIGLTLLLTSCVLIFCLELFGSILLGIYMDVTLERWSIVLIPVVLGILGGVVTYVSQVRTKRPAS